MLLVFLFLTVGSVHTVVCAAFLEGIANYLSVCVSEREVFKFSACTSLSE